MKISQAIAGAILGSALSLSSPVDAQSTHPNDIKPVVAEKFNNKTLSQACQDTISNFQDQVRIIVDKSEGKLIICQNKKPLYPHILRSTSNPSITPTGTFPIDYFKNGGLTPYGMHVDTNVGRDAIFIHRGTIWEGSGKYRVSSGCVGLHHTHAQNVHDLLLQTRNNTIKKLKQKASTQTGDEKKKTQKDMKNTLMVTIKP